MTADVVAARGREVVGGVSAEFVAASGEEVGGVSAVQISWL